ncbi:hypothetical protein [Stenotrophobium rhamnosiphilum]|uniref:DUF2490 domain-containing protein n=1 Tax=Stenotrophobium rhamnosiphilum TaxID=2029166 RepID=A0A2T5MBF0_9GAMM|nr:hypothetical protein [Stenotrophobium rhamnosiphilum]PTU29047.1 hypothetical protein CJD38_16935 [Stenotrophobium rhamnosiphilum]
MLDDDIRILVAQWRSLATYPLLVAALTCSAKCAHAADNSTATPRWNYRDYLLYSAPPSPAMFGHPQNMTQISIGQILQQRNINSGGAARNLLLSAGFDTRADWESIRYGLGFFTNLPEAGQFHFNLYVRANAKRPGFRWQLQPTGLPIVSESGHQNWSVGGYVDYSRAQRGQSTRVGVAPQLILNLSPTLHVPGDAQASIQYAYWRSTLDDDAPQGRALQMALRWRF